MTESQWIRRVVKPLLWVAGLAPLAYQVWAFKTGNLEAEPVKGMEHFTGRTAIIILFIALAITPLRRVTGLNGMIGDRRISVTMSRRSNRRVRSVRQRGKWRSERYWPR